MEKQQTNATPRQVRRFTWAYVIIGLVALFGGLYSVNYRINGIAPYIFSLDTTQDGTAAEQRLAELTELSLQDTDGDGLNDFDELYVYNTSQYVVDSDSDGIGDNDEVTQGTDPNCATGEDCVTTRPVAVETDLSGEIAPEDLEFLGRDLSPEELRDELTKIGISPSLIDQASDEELQAVYDSVSQEYLAAQGTLQDTTVADANPDADVEIASGAEDPYSEILLDTEDLPEDSINSIASIDQLQNLEIDQIRSLLQQGGIPQEELDALGDSELQDLLDQTIEEQFSQVVTE